MKKLFSILIAFAFILSFAVPVFGANPTDSQEDFTMEETIALIVGSDVTYSVQFVGEDTKQSGKIKPVYMAEKDTTNSEYRSFIYFPIPHITEKPIQKLDLVFNLPFTVSSLNNLYFAISPAVFCNGYTIPSYAQYHFFTYQIDNISLPSGSQVIDSLTIHSADYNNANYALADGSLCSFVNFGQKNFYPVSFRGSNRFYFGGADLNSLSVNRNSLFGNNQDITSFGFSYSPGQSFDRTFSDFVGIGFVFAPMSITYASGGGYTPGGTTDPDPPVDPDPTEPTKGEYAQQLDDIYNKLVEQGELDKQIINQNKEVIDNQNEIKGKIDTITTPDEQTKQDVTDFETQVDENDKKLDDVAEGMKIEVPDIETELDTSVIDDALKDNNVLKIFNSIWLTDERLVGVVVLSFLFTIFGVIIRGAYH